MEFTPWTAVFSALLLLLALLLYMRRRGSTTISFRLLGRIAVNNGRPKICPHIGSADDPFIHQDKPSDSHRCYLWMQRDRIDMAHQKGFCLSIAHQFCPWLAVGTADGGRATTRLGLGGVGAGLKAAGVALAFGVGRGLVCGWDRAGARVAGGLGQAGTGVAGGLGQAGTGLGHMGALVGAGLGYAAAQIAIKLPMLQTGVVALAHHSAVGAGLAFRWSKPRIVWMAQCLAQIARGGWHRVKPARHKPLDEAASAPASSDVERLIADGKTAGMAGNRKTALAYFSLAAELDPNNDEVWMWKAAMADGAEEKQLCLEKALALNPANARARAGMGQLAEIGDEPYAVETVEESIGVSSAAASPIAVPVAANLTILEQGLASLERGDEDEAYRLFTRATDLDPLSEKAWFWRAKTATSLAELISCLERALAINPSNEKVKSNLVWALERLEREQRRRRYAQPFAPGMAPIAGGSQPAAAAVPFRGGKAQQEKSRGGKLHWMAGLVSLLLAFYWLWGALVPSMGLPPLPGAEMMARVLPSFDFADATLYSAFEVVPGYNLVDAVPFVVGILFIFIARGLFQRESWSLLWGVVLGAGTIAAAMSFVNNPSAIIVGSLLCVTLAAGIAAGRREFVPNA